MPPRPVTAGAGLPGSDAFPESQRQVGANVAAHGFDHSVTVKRNTATGRDPDGGPVAPVWTDLATVSCLAVPDGGKVDRDDDRVAAIAKRRVLVPAGTDVTTADQLGSVMHGTATVMAGPMRIEAVNRRASFIELVVERIGSK